MSTTHLTSFLPSDNQRTISINDEQLQRKQIMWWKAIESANAQSNISNDNNNNHNHNGRNNRITINPLIKQRRRRRRNEYSSTLQRARMIDTAVVVLV